MTVLLDENKLFEINYLLTEEEHFCFFTEAKALFLTNAHQMLH